MYLPHLKLNQDKNWTYPIQPPLFNGGAGGIASNFENLTIAEYESTYFNKVLDIGGLIQPGDLIIYTSGHINLVTAIDPVKNKFTTLGGNEGDAGKGAVKITSNWWWKQKIAGIVSPIEYLAVEDR